MCICENCGIEHNGEFGSGRFCSLHCYKSFISKQVKNRKCNLPKPKNAPYGTWVCKFCEVIFESKAKLWKHLHEVHSNQIKPFHGKGNVAWNKGKTKETDERLMKTSKTAKQRYAEKINTPSFLNHHHSDETKKILSEKRIAFLKANPDKHPWKNEDKFKSEPCEFLKAILKGNFIDFNEEYTDKEWEHAYSLDIAFLEKKIGIEVNGNQHYNKDMTLKKYYANRQKYLEEQGWKIINIPYYKVYDAEFVKKILEQI